MFNINYSLFPLLPNEGTLSYLIYKTVEKYKTELCLLIKKNSFTYQEYDVLSDDLAAYFRAQKEHINSLIHINEEKTKEYIIVTLAAIKAGLIITDSQDSSIFEANPSLTQKEIIKYSNGFFTKGIKNQSFKEVMKLGNEMLFLNVADISVDDIVYISSGKRLYDNGKISHIHAMKLIKNSFFLNPKNSLISFLYCLKNNLVLS